MGRLVSAAEVAHAIAYLASPFASSTTGTLLAVDTATGDVKWEVPLGTIRDLAPVPIPLKLGTPNQGGPIVTESGIVFISAAMDNYLRAFDVENGKELWKGRLPAGGQATPMTYRLSENGRQFVVIAAGGHGRIGTDIGDSLVAFALPGTKMDVLSMTITWTVRMAGIVFVLFILLFSAYRISAIRWFRYALRTVFSLFGVWIVWLISQNIAVTLLSIVVLLILAWLLLRRTK